MESMVHGIHGIPWNPRNFLEIALDGVERREGLFFVSRSVGRVCYWLFIVFLLIFQCFFCVSMFSLMFIVFHFSQVCIDFLLFSFRNSDFVHYRFAITSIFRKAFGISVSLGKKKTNSIDFFGGYTRTSDKIQCCSQNDSNQPSKTFNFLKK